MELPMNTHNGIANIGFTVQSTTDRLSFRIRLLLVQTFCGQQMHINAHIYKPVEWLRIEINKTSIFKHIIDNF